MSRTRIFVTCWLFLFSLSTFVRADEIDLPSLQKQIYTVVDKTAPAIVEITRRGSVFSGVIVSPQGHVLTAGHTVVDPDQVCNVMLPDGRRFRGKSMGCSEQMRGDQIDCGLIKIEGAIDLPFAEIGSSSQLKTHHPCLSISYPGGQRNRREPLVRFGYITNAGAPGRMIRSTALMEPGDSGGPLLDLDGRVIGIHSRITQGMTENFDVPIDTFKMFWDQLNVPSKFFTQNLKPLPKLGFSGEDYPEKNGIHVLSVNDTGIAKSLGIKVEDYITAVNGRNVARLNELQRTLSDVVSQRPEKIKVDVTRGEEKLSYEFPTSKFDVPKAERLPGMDNAPELASKPVSQLAKLPSVLSQLENKLDDCSCIITSDIDGKKTEITGTFIAASNWVVSKNSAIGTDPSIVSGGKKLVLSIVDRDESSDLVLLKSPELNIAGVTLPSEHKLPRRGAFLLTPDPNNEGLTSVASSTAFKSSREASRGYLGVKLDDNQQGGVILLEVNEGAARKAGLKTGDVILQVDQLAIKDRPQIIGYLQTLDPNTNIKAKVRRETTEFEMEIRLGAPPAESNHAADMMEKSLRRDGFASVFSHDAIVKPEDCGGPVFDLDGNCIGINIARHSRVRAFAVPVEQIKKLVDRHGS
ncbi:MAG: trypsin-like peptidase domain-containing protein [Pirellulales bacterium]